MDFFVLAAVPATEAKTAWQLLQQGGPMVWVLLLVSAFAITAFLERLLYYHRAQINASEFMAGVRTVLKNDNVVEAVAICDATPGPVARLAKLGILNRDQSHERLREMIDDHSRAEVPRLEKRLNMLGTIAQIAPLLGLLGTVLGFIEIFHGVDLAGGNWVLAEDLAGGIWQGLICMALGLAIAVPCTIAFNYLVARKDDIALDIEKSTSELLTILTFELTPSKGGSSRGTEVRKAAKTAKPKEK